MGLTALAILAVAAAPQAQVLTLTGEKKTGEFQSLTAEDLKLKDASGKTISVPLQSVMNVGFGKKPAPKPAPNTVTLVDGTTLTCTEVTVESRAKTALIESTVFGKLKVPLAAVFTIRFGAPDPAYEKKWQELLAKRNRLDRLVVPRPAKKTLDFVPVVVDRVTKENVVFALAGNSQPRPRKLFFGVIFSRAKSAGKPVCNVQLASGDSLHAARISGTGDKLVVRTVSGVVVDLPVAQIGMLDFGLGKIQSLSGLEPRSVDFTPFFDNKFTQSLFRYRKDQSFSGKLTLGKTEFDRGLWIHSKTVLTYRINSDYRRFRTMIGIDYAVAKDGKGHVYVTIKGDKKTLFEGHIRGTDVPRKLDLDVANVVNLVITVDYGDNDSTADHLVLGDARLIK